MDKYLYIEAPLPRYSDETEEPTTELEVHVEDYLKDAATYVDFEIGSCNFKPKALGEFEARGFRRENRWNK
jgi:hypothetical protein